MKLLICEAPTEKKDTSECQCGLSLCVSINRHNLTMTCRSLLHS